MQKLSAQTRGVDRISISDKVDTIRSKVAEIDSQCKKTEEALQALKLIILEQAQVVGTTLAKLHEPLGFRIFDNVIIDEASMACCQWLLLHHQYEKRVILSGDFSQLSPICPTDNFC